MLRPMFALIATLPAPRALPPPRRPTTKPVPPKVPTKVTAQNPGPGPKSTALLHHGRIAEALSKPLAIVLHGGQRHDHRSLLAL